MKTYVQLFCGSIVGIGVGIEIATHADIGYVLITSGSLGLFLATKFLKHKNEGRDE
jgi:hypothetical protein